MSLLSMLLKIWELQVSLPTVRTDKGPTVRPHMRIQVAPTIRPLPTDLAREGKGTGVGGAHVVPEILFGIVNLSTILALVSLALPVLYLAGPFMHLETR